MRDAHAAMRDGSGLAQLGRNETHTLILPSPLPVTCVNRGSQAAQAVILWEQGVAGSNPAVPTTHAKAQLKAGCPHA
jgi:hypothetical protein